MRSFIITVSALAALVSGVDHAVASAPPEPHSIKGCKYEDGSSQRVCVWDARHMGNGSGQSLLIFRGGTDEAKYKEVSHRRAHRLWNGR